MESLFIVYSGFCILGFLIHQLQLKYPVASLVPVFNKERRLDWFYWLLTPLVTGSFTRVATFGLIGFLSIHILYVEPAIPLIKLLEKISIFHLYNQSFILQVVEALLIADFIGYWSHRLRHKNFLWKFHLIHHSPKNLDWLAAARLHPVDDVLDNTMIGVVILLLGFKISVFFALGPIFLLHTLFLHANLKCNLGPLRFFLATPDFHRWHHAFSNSNQRNCNFAGLFSFYDFLFGTYYLPNNKAPLALGVPEEVPDSFLKQLAYPFVKRS
ncbi:sterol desaturase family protein [bacterium]|nr:sterol desaturase family protein [bacterium]